MKAPWLIFLALGAGIAVLAVGCRGAIEEAAVSRKDPCLSPDKLLEGRWEGEVNWLSQIPNSTGCVDVVTLNAPVDFVLGNGRFDPEYGDGTERALYDLDDFSIIGELSVYDPNVVPCDDCVCEKGQVTFDPNELVFDIDAAEVVYLNSILTITFPGGLNGDTILRPSNEPVRICATHKFQAVIVCVDPWDPLKGQVTAYTEIDALIKRDCQQDCDPCPNRPVRVKSIRMQYTGEGCSASQHDQPEGCADCGGNPHGEPGVRVLATSRDGLGGDVWFDGTVLLGEEFVIDAASAGQPYLDGRTWIKAIRNRVTLQEVAFCSKCHTPLHIGDQFGAFKVLEVILADGRTYPFTEEFDAHAEATSGIVCKVED